MYGLNLERRIMDKILYEVDSTDIPQLLRQFYRPSVEKKLSPLNRDLTSEWGLETQSLLKSKVKWVQFI
jgi:hypothetical protein